MDQFLGNDQLPGLDLHHEAPPPMIDPVYDRARNDAGARHNLALLKHTGRPRSYGTGIVVSCGCSQRFNLESWRDHLIAVCIETPIGERHASR